MNALLAEWPEDRAAFFVEQIDKYMREPSCQKTNNQTANRGAYEVIFDIAWNENGAKREEGGNKQGVCNSPMAQPQFGGDEFVLAAVAGVGRVDIGKQRARGDRQETEEKHREPMGFF